ncbi:MAG: hypothetical protein HXY49_10275 [Ignavibacteriaceae bacterium]|nr:hypothetical protein [Ignavibacteriaceae bacterium]
MNLLLLELRDNYSLYALIESLMMISFICSIVIDQRFFTERMSSLVQDNGYRILDS